MDDLYEEIYGKKPSKQGVAYELIVGAVLKSLNKEAEITHNVFFKSPYSSDKYQIDNLYTTNEIIFVETKDHSDDGGKVGRPDVSKLEGALCVLKNNINRGLLASVTDFTHPAKQYTQDLIKASGIPIDLLIIRKVRPADTEGTIRNICININIVLPDFKSAQFIPVWTNESLPILSNIGYKNGSSLNVDIDTFYNIQGKVLDTVMNLTSKIKAGNNNLDENGKWEFVEQAYILIEKTLVPIKSIKYNIPFVIQKKSIEVKAGKPAILAMDLNGHLYKIITFEELQKIVAEENGSYDIK